MDNRIIAILLTVPILYIIWQIFNKIIFPQMVYHGMKELDRNPNWVMSQLQYYGFKDIDIVVCESKWGMLPRFRLSKSKKLELWIDYNTSTKDVEEIGRLALAAKIKLMHGIWFPDKPLYWLSILCYLLDGGDVKVSSFPSNEIHTENK